VRDLPFCADPRSSQLEELECRLFGIRLTELIDSINYDPATQRGWHAILLHFQDGTYTLTRACRESGLSKNSLNQRMKRRTRMTFKRLLTAYRIYVSVRLMLSQDMTFIEAALACGFDSPNSVSVSSVFSRAVKRYLRVSPSRLLPRSSDDRRQLLLPAERSSGRKNDRGVQHGRYALR
jgi:AraC-like DNA-binding protein